MAINFVPSVNASNLSEFQATQKLLKETIEGTEFVKKAIHTTTSPTGCEALLGTKGKRESLKLADCNTNVTKTDHLIIDKIMKDIQELNNKNLENNSIEYKDSYKKIFEGSGEALSPAAKGMLATNVLKEVLKVETNSKKLKQALNNFHAEAEFHVQHFGPGTSNSSLGFLGMTNTPVNWVIDKITGAKRTPTLQELYTESDNRVSKSAFALTLAIKSSDLPDDEKNELNKKSLAFQQMILDRNGKMADATVDRIAAEKSTFFQYIAAVEARLANFALVKTGLSKVSGLKGIHKTLEYSSLVIFREQASLMAQAGTTVGDMGCAWGILAAEENTKIWKEAVLSGMAMGLGKEIGGKLGVAVTVAMDAHELKVDADGLGPSALAAINAYKEGTKLMGMAEQAEADGNIIAQGKLENEAIEKFREYRIQRIKAGVALGQGVADSFDFVHGFKHFKASFKGDAKNIKEAAQKTLDELVYVFKGN